MKFEIKSYTKKIIIDYQKLLEVASSVMFNNTIIYINFLKKLMPDCESYFLCGYRQNELIVALPFFLKKGKFGPIINSLPFFGSHGGLISMDENITSEVKQELFDKLDTFCKEMGVFACTIIESPFTADSSIYASFGANLIDERIGQITTLPENSSCSSIGEDLINSFHSKTRNAIRKGLKSEFDIEINNSLNSFYELYEMHSRNLKSLNGIPKEKKVFEEIFNVFKPEVDYRIYTAVKNKKIISSMLLFYCKDMVEYFCPATEYDYRSMQPLSALIYIGMKDAMLKNVKYWNWGGTWLSQKGVYNFKSRWNTNDYPYRYYIKTYSKIDTNFINKEELLSNYKYFYSIPFSVFE